jgi:broad specificity phosphatase PhoE
MKEIYLIRHAQSEHHTKHFTGGWTDMGLTETGVTQAELAGERLSKIINDHSSICILTSDLIRARDTAIILAKHLEADVFLEPGLRELNNGCAAGLTIAKAKEIENPVTHPTLDWIPYPEAESWRIMTQRIFKCMEQLSRKTSETAVIVSHGNSGIAIIQWWLQLAESCRSGISFDLDLCSISHFSVNSYGERTIVKLNDTCHLQGNDET